jgi:transposase
VRPILELLRLDTEQHRGVRPDWATVHAEHKQPGVPRQEQIFVGALGASHYLYVEIT